MAASYSVLALDTAGRLDRELAALAAHVDDLLELLRGDARASLLVHSVARAIVTAQRLREHTLDTAVGRTGSPIEIHERTLRARMRILVRGLYTLRENENAMSCSAFTERYRTVRDVCAHLVGQVGRIDARWMEQRVAQESLDSVARRTGAYLALDDAEHELERLGRDADLEHFLRVGAASASEPLALACREVAATIGIALVSTCEEATDEVTS